MFATQAKQAHGAMHHSSCFLTPVVIPQGLITCQLRSSVTCMLLRNLLLVPSYAKADAGTADVQTLMSIGEGIRRVQHCPQTCRSSWHHAQECVIHCQHTYRVHVLQMLIGS